VLRPQRIRGFFYENALYKFTFDIDHNGVMSSVLFLADRTNGRAIATLLRLSVVCDVIYCG